MPGAGGRGSCCSWPGSAWAAALAQHRAQPWGHWRGSPSPQPLLSPAGSWPRAPGGPGDPGPPAPAPVGMESPSAPGGACGPLRRSRAQVTHGSTGSASSRAAPAARCLSVPCNAPSTTTSLSWARRCGTAGCPSMEVSPRVVGGITRLAGGRGCHRHHPLPFPPGSGSPQRLRPQLPGHGAQLLLHLRPGAGRHPLQPWLPGPLRRWALPGG